MERGDEAVAAAIRGSIQVKESILEDRELCARVVEIGEAIANALLAGRKVLLFGNGGSAADAQHLAAEFTGRYLVERRPLPALALNENQSALTAIGNDYSFAEVFARQVQALGVAGDVAIGISTSGNSENVIRALQCARQMGLVTVAMTGGKKTAMTSAAQYCLAVPSTETPRIQESQILLGHILCELAERAIVSQ